MEEHYSKTLFKSADHNPPENKRKDPPESENYKNRLSKAYLKSAKSQILEDLPSQKFNLANRIAQFEKKRKKRQGGGRDSDLTPAQRIASSI